ncbi:ribosomal protein S18-alanine N-acetyltransferase [Neisseria sp. WF04]|uniref:ribosomal protein S18-alanine N-acetyltransferase n=1 Tax=unclassified Neisseria TaxID=2623750 RepID=UPI00107234F0|nr:ribosomal protein S18-alanine N-acetyltransferase [Neisseria sp. WF04]MBF0803046.1 ribosomal protein S18-alanine N-acetyltransferase [Neisseria sp. 19428wB4_WF04]TFU44337.1 ribosomal-protein-alanine N-acetyltransferase [Neisseria sp. WF04]
MIIRPALPADCPVLAALDAQCNPSPWSAAQFQTALNNRFDSVTVLAEADGTIGGFAVWQTLCGESELHLIATAPVRRRAGLASRLMAAWFHTAAVQHAERLFLEVRAANLAAQALYRKHGFSEYGRRKAYYPLPGGVWEDAVLMEKLC